MQDRVYTLSDIARVIGAECPSNAVSAKAFQLLIDSRTLTDPENSIFFALKTAFNDGHDYIPELISKGVKVFVCNQTYSLNTGNSVVLLKVADPLSALQELAAFHRQHFKIPVIGITGSNGKTIVKEWLNQLLSNHYRICANPKSFNSQIGVPLSVWQLNADHTLGIFEAGISMAGEMARLEKIIQPELGILTHLGSAHNEGFDNPEEKLNEKLKLFIHCKMVFSFHYEAIPQNSPINVHTFGFKDPLADLNITDVVRDTAGTNIKGHYQNKAIAFRIPFTDDASIENACLCCLVLLYLGVYNSDYFPVLRPVSMRMELKKGIHGCILVNDSYSNDLNALSTALSFLHQQAIHAKKTVILSDIEESGLPAHILYHQVRNLLTEKKINRLIAIGPAYASQRSFFEDRFECHFYADTSACLHDFGQLKFQDESILIKGARKFEFEKITRKLEQESHGTVLEINLSAAGKNLNVIKSRLPSGMKIMAMVKAFAYGSGSYEIAKLLQNKVDYLAVAYADEGVALRKSGIQTPIMVMNTREESFDQLLLHKLEPVVFSLNQLRSVISTFGGIPVRIHIEIDTGMHRLGFTEDDLKELTTLLLQNESLTVATVFSHLSASDDAQFDDFSKQQSDGFRTIALAIEEALGYHIVKHIGNTAAALRFSQEAMDMVRLGIGLYGIDPTGQFNNLLEPVFTLKTNVSQIKTIQANESVGYSRKSIASEARRIAVLALGYADGLNRALSNGKGGFYIRGLYAPIAGNVCMDMCMVDVTHINCEEGDEAILFGKDHPISDIAKQLDTIPYEILTSISQRVKRVYVSE